jgi:hypothetical protein
MVSRHLPCTPVQQMTGFGQRILVIPTNGSSTCFVASRSRLRTDVGGSGSESRALLSEIDVRSIDQIPTNERHGRGREQFTLWFAANMTIIAVVVAGATVCIGLDLPLGIRGDRVGHGDRLEDARPSLHRRQQGVAL